MWKKTEDDVRERGRRLKDEWKMSEDDQREEKGCAWGRERKERDLNWRAKKEWKMEIHQGMLICFPATICFYDFFLQGVYFFSGLCLFLKNWLWKTLNIVLDLNRRIVSWLILYLFCMILTNLTANPILHKIWIFLLYLDCTIKITILIVMNLVMWLGWFFS